ncbi:MAG TPA: SIS domain-containing protein [candidate division Zixibacteria bacterium]
MHKTLTLSTTFEKKSSNQTFIESYLEDMKEVVDKLAVDKIDRIIELLFSAWEEGRTIFVMGNGGSASTATHFACDLSKCTIVDGKKRFKVICLNDNIPLMSALINDNGFDNLFSEQLKNLIQEKDFLVMFSVHGGSGKDKAGLWSQNLLKAMLLAKEEYQATLIGFSGFNGGAMKEVADECLVIPANSTPQVESFHLAMEHLICNCLRKKLEKYEQGGLFR